jgi:nicotinamidase-related amidase
MPIDAVTHDETLERRHARGAGVANGASLAAARLRRMNLGMNLHKLLSPEDVVLTLLDYQPATYFGVQSHDRLTITHNTMILAKTAKLFGIPTVLSTIAKDTFSGPLTSDLTELFPNEPIYDRTSINAWLDAEYRKAIAATGRKRIVVAGLWTEACVLFPALELLAEGYEVFVPTDACADVSVEAHERSVTRLVMAGAVPITSLQLLFELQQDWARSETYDGVMEILKVHSPYGIQVEFSKWALGEHGSEG